MKERERKRLIRKLDKMAFGRANDVVRLAFLTEEQAEEKLGQLDLSMLSEIKRGANGLVEVKLVSRLDILRLLLAETQPEPESLGAAAFLAALNSSGSGDNEDH